LRGERETKKENIDNGNQESACEEETGRQEEEVSRL
jgi:hypothetical protein